MRFYHLLILTRNETNYILKMEQLKKMYGKQLPFIPVVESAPDLENGDQ